MTHNKFMSELRRDLRNWKQHRRTLAHDPNAASELAEADTEIAEISELIETHRHHPEDVST